MSILNDHNCSLSNNGDGGPGCVPGPAPASVAAPSSEAQPPPLPARKLRLKVRAERMDETHRRIAQAAYELHASVGPARTTVSAIAERAGVQRLTVYKHFPNDRDILQACTTYHRDIDPPPDPATWRQINDPDQRLSTALPELYAYYRRNESILTNIERDGPLLMEQLGGLPPAGLQAFLDLPGQWRAALADGWPDDAGQSLLRGAAVGLAVAFTTWRTLVREQALDDAQTVALMTALVRDAASSWPVRTS